MDESPTLRNRRRNRRIDFPRKAQIVFRAHDVEDARIVNISAHGMGLVREEPFSLPLPRGREITVLCAEERVVAKVAWDDGRRLGVIVEAGA